jgi:hypothetical protein
MKKKGFVWVEVWKIETVEGEIFFEESECALLEPTDPHSPTHPPNLKNLKK